MDRVERLLIKLTEGDRVVDDARDRTERTVDDRPSSRSDATRRRDRVRARQATLSGWRQLGRIAYRDPEHVAERLTLYGAGNLGEPSLEWAHERS